MGTAWLRAASWKGRWQSTASAATDAAAAGRPRRSRHRVATAATAYPASALSAKLERSAKRIGERIRSRPGTTAVSQAYGSRGPAPRPPGPRASTSPTAAHRTRLATRVARSRSHGPVTREKAPSAASAAVPQPAK